MDGRRRAGLAGHALDERFEAVEPDDLARQVGERVPAAGEHVERRPVRRDVDAERPEHAQLLVHDVVGLKPGASDGPRVPATTTVPPGRASEMAWANAAGAIAVTSTTTSASPPVAALSARGRVVGRHVDGQVGTEASGEGEPVGVARRRGR